MIETVDVHKLSIVSLEPKLEEYASYLSLDEHIRASRFTRKMDQKKFILIRGHLRSLLSQKTKDQPADIKFSYGLKGKPELPSNPYYFNVSHSKQTVLISISQFSPIGVDIEDHRKVRGIEHPLFFHHDEHVYLQQLKPTEKSLKTLWLWTRKESLCKATGEGLTPHLSDISLLNDIVEYNDQFYQFYSTSTDRDVHTVCIRMN
ncbi:4'-phosphopantetheinyl transferase family protein [Guptibacillus spartinae]|uniref:4'-phosphopantetheinyl transferase family protein n=1 Tax=Guptibacillus spartinae TaxID=3025679 RepID=UPI00235FD299|nr:4'-phosphopantetheinyl transferase superfamily protein [Pseudalkalibacillus spartinae]